MLTCHNAQGEPVNLYLATSKMSTLRQWMHHIDAVIANGGVGYANADIDGGGGGHGRRGSSSSGSDTDGDEAAATTSPDRNLTGAQRLAAAQAESQLVHTTASLSLSWLQSSLDDTLVSSHAADALRRTCQRLNPRLRYNAAMPASQGVPQYVCH